ncbi:hypothetical protein MMC25_005691 [Agyrium rufum]|nr:hypothetical protein [Agyrium rufum]
MQSYTLQRSIVRCFILRKHGFSTSTKTLSGHSRWSKIKHDKGKEDASKTRVRTTLAKELMTASREFGADPTSNSRLALIIANAKKAGFPKASIAAAIDRGQGKSLSGATLESVIFEALFPPDISILIDCLTDSKARTQQDLREIFRGYGVNFGTTKYLFEKRGRLEFRGGKSPGQDADKYQEEVIDLMIAHEVEDVEFEDPSPDEEESTVIVWMKPEDTTSVRAAVQSQMEGFGYTVARAELVWWPKGELRVGVEEENADKLQEFIGRLEEDPAVQDVYLNAQ